MRNHDDGDRDLSGMTTLKKGKKERRRASSTAPTAKKGREKPTSTLGPSSPNLEHARPLEINGECSCNYTQTATTTFMLLKESVLPET